MKANEAPEKIYVSKDLFRWSFGMPSDKNDIEYTRTDAFIEKACELLARMIWEVTYEDLEGDFIRHYDKMEFIEDFRKYMKGE